ncbi:MAG: DUF928 domain-containing protein [Leptolyngbyaceae cyanobacterium MO_188.B28]|nr:DUF928 domain-containing protein [Leptolyngbyaceae cyanobacterium MO_188.B28]
MSVSWQRLIGHPSLKGSFRGVAGFIFISLLSWGMVANAQRVQVGVPGASSAARRIQFHPNVPPPDRGTPRAPHGTGSRGDCIAHSEILPLTQLVGNRGLDLTVSEHPSFWVYAPYTQTEIAAAQFSLQEGDAEIYRTDIQLLTTAGIVELALPTTIPPLEVDKDYRWYFDITCPQSDPADEASLTTITGMVRRVAPSAALESELAIAQSPLEKIHAYAENQIWYETLTELAHLRLSDPDNLELETLWKDLLSDPNIGLGNLSEAPILGEVNRSGLLSE